MEVVLRMLVVKRLYGWSDEETERVVADSLVLRQFGRVYLAPVPDDTTLLRWANLVAPSTLAALNARGVGLARSLKTTRGLNCGWTARWWRPPFTIQRIAASSVMGCAC